MKKIKFIKYIFNIFVQLSLFHDFIIIVAMQLPYPFVEEKQIKLAPAANQRPPEMQ